MATIDTATYEITVEMNLKKFIAEVREVAQAWNGLADELERIEKKYGTEKEKEKITSEEN